jgi:hypothetical protein
MFFDNEDILVSMLKKGKATVQAGVADPGDESRESREKPIVSEQGKRDVAVGVRRAKESESSALSDPGTSNVPQRVLT